MEDIKQWFGENNFYCTEEQNNDKNWINIYVPNVEIKLISIFIKNNNEIEIVEPFKEELYNRFLKESKGIKEIKNYLLASKKFIESNEEEIEKEEIYEMENKSFLVREIPVQMGFLTLMQQLDRGNIIIPKNQRNYVWTKDQVENLAISLIKGFPIPPMYGYRNNKNQLVILDGQQRLISLYLYYKNKFLKNTSITPIDLREILNEEQEIENDFLTMLRNTFGLRDEKYYIKDIKNNEGKEISYDKLDKESKRVIDFRVINIIEILVQSEESDKEEIYFSIFGNLNQGGTQLKNQELRNGIYQSPFYDMLHSINNVPASKWRSIFGPKHKHSRDVELLLRFAATEYMFAFEDDKFNLNEHKKEDREIAAFKDSYPKLLNDFSKIAQKFDEAKIEEFRKNITNFIERIENPENIKNLLLESLYLASQHVKGDYRIEADFIKQFDTDNNYKQNTTAGSSSKSKVTARLNYVYKKLKERYGDNEI